ncbi:ACP S-malonyltransferase [Lentzea flaviverrucosa]|uniref:[acyl-carrier-protein] S-malonyltransferase n=1 Tax=Lentzea flaviverrucosa TaxID=200379 RepID=A0A1H9BXS4_9PSEU|nr:acyltransferase domain-containing protein [Lentzea flaviverrucosa]RDI31649.1 [acyl-carrier-protein] S-malonyltransferase [Lentzea flaviverrucosa]SEP93383.1 [acyl-carrier-protein] S-malonyltransferase [Lentzea flaviverrucosa]
MSRTAVVFPGMGPSKFDDVGRFMTVSPFARRRLAEANAALGCSLLDELRTGPDEYNAAQQIGFLVNSVAMADWMEKSLGFRPDMCVGSSFGERAAVAYSGAMPFAEVVRLTAELARCELDYFREEHRDLVSQLVVRTPQERLDEVLATMSENDEWHEISGYFDDSVHLVTMHEEHLAEFKRKISDRGGYSLTTMRPAAHARVLAPLRARMREEVFGKFSFTTTTMPIISDQDGSLVSAGAEVGAMLEASTVNPVHWGHVHDRLVNEGFTRICVAGPDFLIHRLGLLRKNFEVVAAGPKDALKSRRPSK